MSDQKPVIMQDTSSQAVTDKEVIITRSKGFWYIMYLKIISRVFFSEESMKIDTTKNWLYFIKGTPSSVSIDYKSIVSLEVKKVFGIWDLIFAGIFLINWLFFDLDIWWLLLTALFVLSAFGKSIIISLNNNLKVIIPADGLGIDTQLIKQICDQVKAHAPQVVMVDSKKGIVSS
jgi:hypothetical protein